MALTRAQKKAKMSAAVDEAIERLLDWDGKNVRPNLTQIEDIVLAIRQRLGQELAGVVMEGQEAQ